jgi:hypothetical protein
MIATGAVNALIALLARSERPRHSVRSRCSRGSHHKAALARTTAVVVCRDAGIESHTCPHTRQDPRRSLPCQCAWISNTPPADERSRSQSWSASYSVLDLAALHCCSACAGSSHPMGYA